MEGGGEQWRWGGRGAGLETRERWERGIRWWRETERGNGMGKRGEREC